MSVALKIACIFDTLKVIPSFLLVAMIVRAGESGWLMLIFGPTAFGWDWSARTIRTTALSLRERDYVKAAKYMGVPPFTIIVRHLIPNLVQFLLLTWPWLLVALNTETAFSSWSVLRHQIPPCYLLP